MNKKIQLIALITILTIYTTAFGQTKTNIQSIARSLSVQVPEINEKYDRTHSNDEHYLYRSAEDAEYGDKELQMYWYERPTASNDWVLVSYNYPPEPWLKCFTFDRKTGALKETDLPFTIPPAHEFDNEEFDKEQTYWRSEYMICENGDVVISASPSMNAICVTLAQWDKKGSFTIYKRGIEFSHGEPVEETITNDILSLPEMQFPHAAVMIVDEPTAEQPYFTVKGGSNMDDHFATSFWFHVYTAPEYEIRLYDVALDIEMTLEEWRNSKSKYDEI